LNFELRPPKRGEETARAFDQQKWIDGLMDWWIGERRGDTADVFHDLLEPDCSPVETGSGKRGEGFFEVERVYFIES